jgi:SWIM zinc finger
MFARAGTLPPVGTRLHSDQVIGLAPDAASVAAGRKLATPGPWSELGCHEQAVWGRAKGSGKLPYQVAVDLSGPAYTCSCPSRKIPCKHVLGLLLLWSQGEAAVAAGEPPAHVAEWLGGRAERAAATETRAAQRAAREADPEAQAARRAARSAAITAGLAELERFLCDLVREGLAAARQRPAGWWDAQARRLVDAQAPGLAERVRRLGATLHAGRDGWPQSALEQAGMLYLAVRAWRRDDTLPDDLRDDLRAQVGWARQAREVREATPALPGPWAVIGVVLTEQDRLRVRRSWLQRPADGRAALILDFAVTGAAFETAYAVGTILTGDLHPYPGRSGLRTLPASELAVTGRWDGPSSEQTIARAIEQWSAAIAADPFTERIAVAVAGVVPAHASGLWWLRAADGNALPIAGDPPWPLVALAGGTPVGVAGEWNGIALRPMVAHAGRRTHDLTYDLTVAA